MRVSIILALYRFKVKAFLGALRASKASVALLLIYSLGLLPSIFGFSLIISNAVREGGASVKLYIEVLASVTSLFMFFAVLSALRSYVAFEHEQSFVFTAPITPREFLVAGIFADFTSSLIFTHPIFLLYGITVHSLSLPAPSALLMLISILTFTFMLFLLKISLSILKALYRGGLVNALISVAAILLMLPAASLLVNLPFRYSLLPYPSSFLAKILVGMVYGINDLPLNLAGLVLYFLASVLLFHIFSGKNFFPAATYMPLISPFDTSMRVQTLKLQRSISMFSKMGRFLTLSLESRSLLGFLMRKEIIRMIREGSLFTIILFYVIISFVVAATSSGQAQGPPPALFLVFFVGIYSLIIPLMLVSNWRLSDLENLWVPLTSGVDMRIIARAILYDFILLSSAVPTAIILVLSAIYSISPLMPLTIIVSTSMIGCSVNLYIMVKFLGRGRRGTPSLLVGWVSMLLSALLLSPVYILIITATYLGLEWALIGFSAVILAYSTLMARFFSRKIEKEISRVEI